jgi:DNA-binding MarR family transcriptional regulator
MTRSVHTVDALQRRNLIERQPDPTDRRRHAVALTPAGRAALDDLRRAGDEVEEQLLDCLTPTERGALHQTLRKLLAALDG